MIKWRGQNTQRNITWTEEANTYKELYYKLIDKNIISVEDYFPDEEYRLNKVGLRSRDFDGDIAEEYKYDFQEWYEDVTKDVPEITEEEYSLIIKGEKGNAYYQEFEEVVE